MRSRLFWSPGLAVLATLAGGCGGGVLGSEGSGGMGRLTGIGNAAGGAVGTGNAAGGAVGTGNAAGGAVGTGNAGGGVAGIGGPGGGTSIDMNPRAVDILFMIDNSTGMRLAQANLLRNFPTLISPLKNHPSGLPSIHIAVITSDMGAGDGSISSCLGDGDAGIFQYAARGACTATNLAPGATYISDTGSARNFTGTIEDVFSCIAAVGQDGCGFEQPLAAIMRALGADGRPAPAENQGFLRPEALLFIALLTDEDDCSVPPGSGLFDTTSNLLLASTLGPPANYRCNEFGHLCGGARPPRRASTGSTGEIVSLAGCTSAEGAGMLTPVATVAQRLQALKADPSMVLVGAIAGPSAPYTVNWKAPSITDTSCGAASCPWPFVAHSCTASDTSFADPAVRINQWASAFGSGGSTLSLCSDNYASLFQTLAERLASLPPVGPIP